MFSICSRKPLPGSLLYLCDPVKLELKAEILGISSAALYEQWLSQMAMKQAHLFIYILATM